MKILIVVPRLNIGGAESYVYELAQGLTKQQIEVVIASGGGYLADTLTKQGIKHYYCPIRLNQALAAYRLKQIIREEKIDLVHANSTGAAYPVSRACLAESIPWVMTAHGVFREKEAVRGINRAAKVICVSRFLERYLLSNTTMDAHQFTVIYNGIDLSKFHALSTEKRLQVRARWGLRPDDFVVGIVARMARPDGKGHQSLIKAMAQEPSTASWKLLAIGKGKAAWRLKLAAWRKNLSHRVVFTGQQKDIPSLIHACDALVLPSQIETFGLVLAEGMGMGKPVIAYRVGGTPEAIRNGQTGFLTNAGDIGEVLRRIHELQSNPALCSSMGEAGITHVTKYFNINGMVRETVKLYQEILHQ